LDKRLWSMSAIEALFQVTPQQKRTLPEIIRVTRDARLLRRGQALLWHREGESIAAIAERLEVSRQTVYNWVARFAAATGSLAERLADAERSGRPATATGRIDSFIADLIATDPRDFGYAATAWTAPLLQKRLAEQHQADVSVISVRRALPRLRRRWKRPRYRLALRPATWRQAKGGSRPA
jgi:transposase